MVVSSQFSWIILYNNPEWPELIVFLLLTVSVLKILTDFTTFNETTCTTCTSMTMHNIKLTKQKENQEVFRITEALTVINCYGLTFPYPDPPG